MAAVWVGLGLPLAPFWQAPPLAPAVQAVAAELRQVPGWEQGQERQPSSSAPSPAGQPAGQLLSSYLNPAPPAHRSLPLTLHRCSLPPKRPPKREGHACGVADARDRNAECCGLQLIC